jgi:hypothetical protein
MTWRSATAGRAFNSAAKLQYEVSNEYSIVLLVVLLLS